MIVRRGRLSRRAWYACQRSGGDVMESQRIHAIQAVRDEPGHEKGRPSRDQRQRLAVPAHERPGRRPRNRPAPVAAADVPGRNSGMPHALPVACLDHNDGYLIVGTGMGGSKATPQGFLNPQAAGKGEIQIGGRGHTWTRIPPSGTGREKLWPQIAARACTSPDGRREPDARSRSLSRASAPRRVERRHSGCSRCSPAGLRGASGPHETGMRSAKLNGKAEQDASGSRPLKARSC